MIYISDLQQLSNSWTERLGNSAQPLPYRDALSECIYELNNLISKSIKEEFDYHDFLEMQADEYLSSIDAHERAA